MYGTDKILENTRLDTCAQRTITYLFPDDEDWFAGFLREVSVEEGAYFFQGSRESDIRDNDNVFIDLGYQLPE